MQDRIIEGCKKEKVGGEVPNIMKKVLVGKLFFFLVPQSDHCSYYIIIYM